MTNDENTNLPSTQSQLPRRRRLVGGGAAVTVLASLKSGSVLAEGVCISGSAFSSIRANTAAKSHAPKSFETCHSHGYWKTHSWPISIDTTVSGAGFSPSSYSESGFSFGPGTKLMEIINATGGGAGRAFAADLVSAFLDALSAPAKPFTVDNIKGMWGLVFGGIPYQPSSSPPWTPADVRAFLDVLIGVAPNPYI